MILTETYILPQGYVWNVKHIQTCLPSFSRVLFFVFLVTATFKYFLLILYIYVSIFIYGNVDLQICMYHIDLLFF